MRTIHEANGRGPRAEESRAPAIVRQLRALDPHLVAAMQDPSNLRRDGRLSLKAVARSLDRTVPEVNRDLATLRELLAV